MTYTVLTKEREFVATTNSRRDARRMATQRMKLDHVALFTWTDRKGVHEVWILDSPSIEP